MSDPALEAVLRRDRYVVLAALLGLVALAWSYLLWLSRQMVAMPVDMDMPGMDMSSMAPLMTPWATADFVFTSIMWAVMMVGMMTPSVAPMILLYARVGRQAEADGKPLAAAGWFAAGYFLSWIAFSLVAAVLQGLLHHATLLTPMMASRSDTLGGIILIVAGLYQWSRLKDVCLTRCQQPLQFIQRCGGFRRTAYGSLALGLRHGAYCIGCCWALMLLLFVGGVMNILWIAFLAAFVLLEKLSARMQIIPRIFGSVSVIAGITLLYRNASMIAFLH